MIAGQGMSIADEDQKSRQERRMEERVKCLQALVHMVNFVSAQDQFYPAAPIVFIVHDLQTVRLPHDDPLVIKLQVDQAILGKVLVDRRSSGDVILWDAFQKMGLDEKVLIPTKSPLVAFDESRAYPRGIA